MTYFIRKLKKERMNNSELKRLLNLKEVALIKLQRRCTALEDELLFATNDMTENINRLKEIYLQPPQS